MKILKWLSILLVIIGAMDITATAQTKANNQNATLPVYNFNQLSPMLNPAANNDTVYLFNFWATYCAPCIKELPYFDRIAKEYVSQKVKVILISLDFKSDIDTRVIPFIKKNNIKSKVILLSDPDANTWIDKVSTGWSGALPFTLVVKGSTRQTYEKAFTYDELKKVTTNLLKK